MAGVEIATAYISLAPSARGIVNALQRDLSGSLTSAAGGEGDRAGALMGDRLHAGLGRKIAGIGTLLAGVGTGVALAGLFKGAITEATEAQKVMGQTGAVIKSTGGAAGLSAEGFGALAGKLSEVSGVDDEIIQQGENVLATFTQVKDGVGAGNDIFSQATGAALDMSKAMGTDLQSSIVQVGKALQNPVEGVGALQRVGVRLTDQQKDQVKAFVASGDVMSAQKLILKELATEFGGTAAAVATPMEKLQTTFKNVLESVGLALGPALAAIAPVLGQMLVALEPVLTTLGTSLAQVLQLLAPIFVQLAPPISQLIGLLGQILVPVAGLLAGLAPIAALFLQLAATVLQALMPAFLPLVAALNAVVRAVGEALVPVMAEIIPIIRENAGVFADYIKALVPLIPALGQILIALLPLLPPLLQLLTLQVRLFGTIVPLIAKVAEFAAVLIGGLAGAIGVIVGWVRDSLIPWFGRIPETIGNIISGIGDFVGKVLDWFTGLPGKITGALGDMASLLLNAGKDLILGFIRGIESMAGRIISAIKSTITDHLPGFVKDALGIGSPSKVFMELGEQTGTGFALGIESSEDRIRRALEKAFGFDSQALGFNEDDPRWDWRTMGNQERGVNIGGRMMIQHADGSITDTHPNPTVITVPVSIDGRQVASAQAQYSPAADRSFRRSQQ